MGDLTELDRAGNTKLVGSNPSGSETNFADVTANQDLKAVDGLFTTLVDGDLQPTPGMGIAIDANVSGSNLVGRKLLVAENFGKKVRYRKSGSSERGITMEKGDTLSLNIGEGITLEFVEANVSNEIKIYIQEWA